MKKILTIAVALICAASLFAAPKAKKTKKSKIYHVGLWKKFYMAQVMRK